MRVTLLGVALALAVTLDSGLGNQGVTVPFVGCPENIQGEATPPPKGAPKIVRIDAATARQIAYYAGENGPGVFAPRGWHCHAWAGSGGSSMVVTPADIDSVTFGVGQLVDDAVEINFHDGGTSGRFSVAIYASRLFPKVAADFIASVKGERFIPDSEFTRGPYSRDSVAYVDTVTARFSTPANTNGLGTEGYLSPSQHAIRGVALLTATGDWGLSIIRVRLAPGLRQIETALLDLNKPCLVYNGC